MTEHSRNLLSAALAGVVVVVVGTRLSDELLGQLLTSFTITGASRIMTLLGAVSIGVGLLAVLVCRLLGAARGVPARVAAGTGVAVAAVSIGWGVSSLVVAVQFAVDASPGVLLHDAVPAVVLGAVALGGLRLAGAEPRPAAVVALTLGAVFFVVNQVDLLRFSQDLETLDLLHRARYYLLLVAMPVLGAAAAIRLAPTGSEEQAAREPYVR